MLNKQSTNLKNEYTLFFQLGKKPKQPKSENTHKKMRATIIG